MEATDRPRGARPRLWRGTADGPGLLRPALCLAWRDDRPCLRRRRPPSWPHWQKPSAAPASGWPASPSRTSEPSGRTSLLRSTRPNDSSAAPNERCNAPSSCCRDLIARRRPLGGRGRRPAMRRQAADPGCRCKPGGGNLVDTAILHTALPTATDRIGLRRRLPGCGGPPAAAEPGSTGRCPRARSGRIAGSGRRRSAGRGGSSAG